MIGYVMFLDSPSTSNHRRLRIGGCASHLGTTEVACVTSVRVKMKKNEEKCIGVGVGIGGGVGVIVRACVCLHACAYACVYVCV